MITKIKTDKNGDFIEIEGEQDFVKKTHDEFLTLSKKNSCNERVLIGIIYLFLFIIFSLMTGSINWSDFVFYGDKQKNDLYKNLGLIFFVFSFALLGTSFRAFKLSEFGKVSPWRAYFLEYPIINTITTFIIFSSVSLVVGSQHGFIFYTLSAPLAIIAGFGGYATIKSLMGKIG